MFGNTTGHHFETIRKKKKEVSFQCDVDLEMLILLFTP